MRRFIDCPRCQIDGKRKILGEIFPDNVVAIARQRSKYSYEESTLVRGKDFELICGFCRTPVYIRKEVEYESGNQWQIGIYWNSSVIGTLIQRISGGGDPSGTSLFAQ